MRPDLEEHLLGDFLGLGTITQDRAGDTQNGSLGEEVEVLERCGDLAGDLRQQRGQLSTGRHTRR